VYRELYSYMFADRVVCASRMTVWRQTQNGEAIVGIETGQFDYIDKQPSQTDLLLVLDDVIKTTQEKEYILLKIQGKTEDEIKEHLKICLRIVHDIRARIIKRLKLKGVT
jgi:DNA-binding CsgD family transcriptional regulator